MAIDPASAPVDLDNLRSLFRDSLNEALVVFVGVARTVASDLPRVLQGRDSRAVWTTAHKLVGSSRMAGAAALVSACEALCGAADIEDWPAADAAAARIVEEVARLEAWFAEWCRDREGAPLC